MGHRKAHSHICSFADLFQFFKSYYQYHKINVFHQLGLVNERRRDLPEMTSGIVPSFVLF